MEMRAIPVGAQLQRQVEGDLRLRELPLRSGPSPSAISEPSSAEMRRRTARRPGRGPDEAQAKDPAPGSGGRRRAASGSARPPPP